MTDLTPQHYIFMMILVPVHRPYHLRIGFDFKSKCKKPWKLEEKV